MNLSEDIPYENINLFHLPINNLENRKIAWIRRVGPAFTQKELTIPIEHPHRLFDSIPIRELCNDSVSSYLRKSLRRRARLDQYIDFVARRIYKMDDEISTKTRNWEFEHKLRILLDQQSCWLRELRQLRKLYSRKIEWALYRDYKTHYS